MLECFIQSVCGIIKSSSIDDGRIGCLSHLSTPIGVGTGRKRGGDKWEKTKEYTT